ncbi:LysR substrate-binding domain-containing protein [Aliiglaciecola sp. 3_MG-2023]|uniref:LysR substrate-binding domain-containing protein n=1 Tax=Aliiglaciecola sp. 3_MG-2023 TaxID=3062644 RepID=UPI0026E1AD82|nr:LysR substrate-binding domain-containing protein [Aliiglaciecola sp. 3_MG-2023]MDO6694512.1 LysR substrate-binding domain-containing protein [Aliiglaciecola sp. 3_MG-2023]
MKHDKSPYIDLRQIPLNALLAFEAAGRHCHLRRAAQEMFVSHSALSRHIKLLEARLNTQLFERKNNKLRLTAAGSRLLSSIQIAFTELNKGLHLLDPTLVAGEIVIGTTATIMLNWLLPVLANVQRQYPEISFKVQTLEPHQQSLPSNLDIALCLGQPEDPVKTITKLYDEYYVPVCNQALLKGKNLQSVKALLNYPLLHDGLGQWFTWFSHHQLDGNDSPQHTYFEYAYQAIEAARLGMGLALADIVEVSEDIQQGKLMQVGDSAHTEGQSVFLVTHDRTQMNYRTQLVLRSILQNLEQKGARLESTAHLNDF